MIFHITTAAEWERAKALGSHQGDTLESDGFIHCSTADQVSAVANSLFRGRIGLLLLCIDEDKLLSETRWEGATEAHFFPHVYGPINLEAVVEAIDFPAGSDGTFELPAEARAMV